MNDKVIRVLLLEDNKPDADLIQGMLKKAKKAGFIVEVCSTLLKGLERLAKGNIDVTLLDLSPRHYRPRHIRQDSRARSAGADSCHHKFRG